MKSTRKWAVGVACLVAAAALLWPLGTASAEFIRLADGTTIQGRIDTQSVNENGLTVRRFDTGGVIRLRWNQLHADDRTKLRREFNLELPDLRISITTPGDRVEMLNGDVWEGRVVAEDERRITVRYLNNKGEEERTNLNKAEIAEVFKNVPVNALALKTPQTLYAELMDKYPPQDAKGHYRMAHFCKMLGLCEKGLVHIASAVAGDSALETQLAPLRALFEDLIAQDDIRLKIEEAARLIRRDKFGQAEAMLGDILKIQGLAGSLKSLCEEQLSFLNREAADKIAKRWYRLIEVVAGRRVGRSGTDLETAKAFATGEMNAEILASLVVTFGMSEERISALFASRDPNKYRLIKVTFDQTALEGRPRNSPANAPRAGQQGGAQGGNRNQNPNQQQIQDLMRRMRENPEAANEMRKQLEQLLAGNRSVEEADTPADGTTMYGFEPNFDADNADDAATPGPVMQQGGRDNRGGGAGFGGNPGGGGNQAGGGGNQGGAQGGGRNQPQQPTPQEMWERSSQTTRKNYVIYLYCEAHPAISRVKEREYNGAMQYWYR